MSFAKWMAGSAGRSIRVVAGLLLMAIGLYVQGTWGIVIGIVGIVPIAAGVLNVCLLAPLLGVPLGGGRLGRLA